MSPVDFPEANRRLGPPSGMVESQVGTIHVCVAQIERGSCEGLPVFITAWQPSADDLARLNAGGPIFLSILAGGLPPHMLTTEFRQAIAPA